MQVIAIIAAILLFILLIAIHEFGHFAAGKLLGVPVLEFSIGMGPLIFSKKKKETQYSLRAIPIGGYCKFEGEEEDSENPKSFSKQPPYKRAIICCAGAFMNFVLCLVLFFTSLYFTGNYSNKLEAVTEGGPAATAGIQAGDVIVNIDGTEYTDWLEIVDAIDASKGGTMSITVLRSGQRYTYDVTSNYNAETGSSVIGIQCMLVKDFPYAVKNSFTACKEYYQAMVAFFGTIFKGEATINDVSGVVGIVSTVGETAQYGVMSVIFLMGIISLNLAFVNMLPLPALDGGRVLFIIIRWVTRDKLSEKTERIIHSIGMYLLLLLMAALVVKDVYVLIK